LPRPAHRRRPELDAGGWLLVRPASSASSPASSSCRAGRNSMWVIGLLLGIDLIFSGFGWLTYLR
jgi:hypothetical protein